MKLLLLGLTDQESAAIEGLAARSWAGTQSLTVQRTISHSVPPLPSGAGQCQLCVVDLFGLGMRKHSAAAEQVLRGLLAGRPALLFYWGDGGGWLDAFRPDAGQPVEMLKSPVTPPRFRSAINQLLRASPALAGGDPAVAAPGALPTPSTLRRKEALAPGERVTYLSLRSGSIALLGRAMPGLAAVPVIAHAERVAQAPHPVVLKYADEILMVADLKAQGGVLASSQSLQNLHRIISTPGYSEAITHSPAQPADLEAMGGRTGFAPDVAMWELVDMSLRTVPLRLVRDMGFVLQRWPNFTAISKVSSLQLQAAARCLTSPTTVSALLRQFPADKADEVLRFVALAVVAGLAGVAEPPARADAGRTPTSAREPAPARRKNLFKALLDKIF